MSQKCPLHWTVIDGVDQSQASWTLTNSSAKYITATNVPPGWQFLVAIIIHVFSPEHRFGFCARLPFAGRWRERARRTVAFWLGRAYTTSCRRAVARWRRVCIREPRKRACLPACTIQTNEIGYCRIQSKPIRTDTEPIRGRYGLDTERCPPDTVPIRAVYGRLPTPYRIDLEFQDPIT